MPVANSSTPISNLSVGELARMLDITARDVLDELIEAGVQVFWHDGQRIRSVEALRSYLGENHFFNPVPELEFELSADQIANFAAGWNIDLSPSSASSKPVRKFVGSDAELPKQGQRVGCERLG